MAANFSGGDHLKPEDGLSYYVHKAMMQNELRGGQGAYEMSNAKNASSGPSFGAFQYDVGSNPDARTLLEGIAKNAKDAQGQRYMSDTDMANMKTHCYKPFKDMSAADRATYNALKPKLDKALDSAYGHSAMNTDYRQVLNTKVKAVEDIIANVSNPKNKAFLQSNMEAQVTIADIRNQYGPGVQNALNHFLSQDEKGLGVKLPNGGHLVKMQGNLDMQNLKNFRLGTQYGINHPTDANRRIHNIEQMTHGAKVPGKSPAQNEPQKPAHSAIEPSLNVGSNQQTADSTNPEVQALHSKLHEGLADKITQAGGGKWLEPMLAETTYACIKNGINANNIGYMDINAEKNNILVMSQNKNQFAAVNAKVDPHERLQATNQLHDTMQQQTLAMAQQPERNGPGRSV